MDVTINGGTAGNYNLVATVETASWLNIYLDGGNTNVDGISQSVSPGRQYGVNAWFSLPNGGSDDGLHHIENFQGPSYQIHFDLQVTDSAGHVATCGAQFRI